MQDLDPVNIPRFETSVSDASDSIVTRYVYTAIAIDSERGVSRPQSNRTPAARWTLPKDDDAVSRQQGDRRTLSMWINNDIKEDQ